MIYLYFLCAALLIYLSVRSLQGGIYYLAYFKKELAKSPSGFTPFASVIAPCKGTDAGLAANLAAVLDQDYPEYEVIFVVDDPTDPAVRLIEDAARNSAGTSKVVYAQKAADSGQKVESLREAVLHTDSRSDVLAFVDSDVRPGKDWLRSLVAPLADDSVGATSGYRWFVSENSNFATELRSSWNASIASVQGPDMGSNFCWGGSMSVRRDVFERLNIREKWRGTLSDDLAVTRSMNVAGLPIYFVPQAVVPSSGTCSFRELFEFTNRQIKITRIYAPKLWITSFLGSGLFNAVMIASLGVMFTDPSDTFAWYAALFTIISVTLLSVGKAWLRAKAIRMVLRENRATLDRQFIYQITLWLFTPCIFLINCSAALFSRRITWRGTEYEMTSPTETKVL